jgi:hypothetical protein
MLWGPRNGKGKRGRDKRASQYTTVGLRVKSDTWCRPHAKKASYHHPQGSATATHFFLRLSLPRVSIPPPRGSFCAFLTVRIANTSATNPKGFLTENKLKYFLFFYYYIRIIKKYLKKH